MINVQEERLKALIDERVYRETELIGDQVRASLTPYDHDLEAEVEASRAQIDYLEAQIRDAQEQVRIIHSVEPHAVRPW